LSKKEKMQNKIIEYVDKIEKSEIVPSLFEKEFILKQSEALPNGKVKYSTYFVWFEETWRSYFESKGFIEGLYYADEYYIPYEIIYKTSTGAISVGNKLTIRMLSIERDTDYKVNIDFEIRVGISRIVETKITLIVLDEDSKLVKFDNKVGSQ
jgi:hypothetical protein